MCHQGDSSEVRAVAPADLRIGAHRIMTEFLWFAVGVLSLCAAMCMFRIVRGPTPPDRTVAIDILGVILVGMCAIVALISGHDFSLTIAIAWSLLAFIGTIALAKHLEGKSFDE